MERTLVWRPIARGVALQPVVRSARRATVFFLIARVGFSDACDRLAGGIEESARRAFEVSQSGREHLSVKTLAFADLVALS